ncbi:hypothetical protein [Roseococcus pinisoli]|uniref:Uncharacterized protein n=1 Tax=Roseococcus pinisoli TaxID=2835040 RepID=A0ABS5QF58_9PROT|nr:hypothetical protein [Roseococcus pinisoli]MBS7811188.1 hypothetical protein [Roseococcus pinisoli]
MEWIWSRTGAALLRLTGWLAAAATLCLRHSKQWLEPRGTWAAALSLLTYAGIVAGPAIVLALIVLGCLWLIGVTR